MYTIDKRDLMSAIAISLLPPFKNERPEEDAITLHFHLALDIILGVMNSDTRNIDDALEDQLLQYPDQKNLAFLFEVIKLEIIDIKKQFMLAGFDRRLKYKLITRPVGLHKLYAIQMDLEATAAALATYEEVEEEDNAFSVSQEPTLDELNAAYHW